MLDMKSTIEYTLSKQASKQASNNFAFTPSNSIAWGFIVLLKHRYVLFSGVFCRQKFNY